MKNFIQHVVYSHREGLRWYFKSTERKGTFCREIMEETGYVITPEVPKFVEVETSPKANKQNITLRYTALVPYKLLSQVKPIGGEDNEVEEVKWIDIRKLNNYKWAFNHNKIIERIILLKQYIQNDRHKHFS